MTKTHIDYLVEELKKALEKGHQVTWRVVRQNATQTLTIQIETLVETLVTPEKPRCSDR